MTTVIVDRLRGEVLSDSRGTETKISSEVSWLPYPKRKTKTENIIHDDTKKVFRLGKTVITGSGSLQLLLEVVDRFKSYQYFTPDHFWMKTPLDMDNTTVLVNKKYNGKVRTVQLDLTPKRIYGIWVRVKVTKHYPDTAYTIIGSGRQYATGAVEVGSFPEEAINVAKKYDTYSGGETQKEVL
ncbi:peptidase HslV family [Vibrio phage F99]|nr:hypothetical protein MYOV085v1_p0167 [Vibrio phage 355E48.1]